jgi:branched-chain amino acid transport system substrate-binding protein
MTSRALQPARRRRVLFASLTSAALACVLVLSGCAPDVGGAPEASPECGPDAAPPPVVASDIVAESPAVDRASSLTIGSFVAGPTTDPAESEAERAGIALAVSEVNASVSGVLGGNVALVNADPTKDAASAATALLESDLSAIIGPPQDPAGQADAIDQITAAGVVLVSPSDSSVGREGFAHSDYYFRAIPSHAIEATVLGDRILSDHRKRIAILSLGNDYGRTVTNRLQQTIEDGGSKVVATSMFDETTTEFGPVVSAVVAAEPDAIVLVSDQRTQAVIPALMTAKVVKNDRIYLIGQNVIDYSAMLTKGALDCGIGAVAGAQASDDFESRLRGADPKLTNFGFAAEAYDSVNLTALAAIEAGSTDSLGIRGALRDVSEGGTACRSFAECADLLTSGQNIDYEGPSGSVSFDAVGDAGRGPVGIYEYGKGNTTALVSTGYGTLYGH